MRDPLPHVQKLRRAVPAKDCTERDTWGTRVPNQETLCEASKREVAAPLVCHSGFTGYVPSLAQEGMLLRSFTPCRGQPGGLLESQLGLDPKLADRELPPLLAENSPVRRLQALLK